ncbi:hypothetical protein KFK09_027381 [Dendrobium nobile]|uniref:Uncharacterized protein n=1 Tax=Dendrobium nobile TaxID=94219 RepID=A0A8T3AFS6_DENNO|nr:hypothetical protein KFK09_027381 [Dendrobium nobile]
MCLSNYYEIGDHAVLAEVAEEGVNDLTTNEDHEDVEDEYGERSGHGRGLEAAAGFAYVPDLVITFAGAGAGSRSSRRVILRHCGGEVRLHRFRESNETGGEEFKLQAF